MFEDGKIKIENKKPLETYLEKAEALQKFCETAGNPIYFLRKDADDFDFEKGQNLNESYEIGGNYDFKESKINPEILIDPNKASFVLFYLDVFKSFLNGPIFSDRMKNHSERFPWKEKNKEFMKEKGIFDYFRSNKLRKNFLAGILGPLEEISRMIKDPEIKDKIFSLASGIPEEFNKNYNESSDFKTKINFLKKISKILEEVIKLLEK